MRKDGVYRFDPTKLGDAHNQCVRSFTECMRMPAGFIVVDNTNISAIECAPYMALAAAYGYEAEIHQLTVDPQVAAARNLHGVPAEVIQKMADRLATEQLPPWWKLIHVS